MAMKTVYVKHPQHGNKHVSEQEAAKLVNEGWTRWPRSKEEKEGRALHIELEPIVVTSGPVDGGPTSDLTEDANVPKEVTERQTTPVRKTLSLKR